MVGWLREGREAVVDIDKATQEGKTVEATCVTPHLSGERHTQSIPSIIRIRGGSSALHAGQGLVRVDVRGRVVLSLLSVGGGTRGAPDGVGGCFEEVVYRIHIVVVW